RLRHRPRRGRADRTDLWPSGRRPDYRPGPAPIPEVVMITAELNASGVTDQRLRAAYQHCRELNARHGQTYYLATKLLAPAQRPAVHALYGFARLADDVVDDVPAGTPLDQVAGRLGELRRDLFSGLAQGHSPDPVLAAVVDTA